MNTPAFPELMSRPVRLLPTIFWFLTCCAILAGFGSALAQERAAAETREATNAELLKRYDRNGNGVLDPDEIEDIARDRIRVWDKDGSGRLSQSDLKAMREASKKSPPQTREERMQALERARADERAAARKRTEASKSKGKAKNQSRPAPARD